MRKKMSFTLLLLAAFLAAAGFVATAAPAPAATSATVAGTTSRVNTTSLEPGAARPAATLADAAFLEGHWVGTGLGGHAEEMWSPPLAGAVMGVFRSIKDGKVSFYEILLVAEEEGSLALKLKHFDAGLVGWEEKAEVRSFPLVKKATNELWFSGITIRREGDVLWAFVAIRYADGKVVEEPFEMRRVGG